MRIRHVVNTIGSSARPDLLVEQDRVLHSIRRAVATLPPEIEVEVVAVRFPDDPLPHEWLVDGPPLERSVLDLGDFPGRGRLPLLVDLLRGFSSTVGSPWDLGLFTNIDIVLQPTFYEFVADLHRSGFDAFTVNRRTVEPPHADASFAEMAAAISEAHPGHDCFVFTPQVLHSVDVDDVCVGVPGVGLALLLGLALGAERFRLVNDAHVTFHVGNDRPWMSPSFDRLTEHNRAALDRVRASLAARHGIEMVRHTERLLEHDAGVFVRWSLWHRARRRARSMVWRTRRTV